MRRVDVKGAIHLARRLHELHGDDVAIGPSTFDAEPGVRPMFIWTGVEPPARAEGDDADPTDAA